MNPKDFSAKLHASAKRAEADYADFPLHARVDVLPAIRRRRRGSYAAVAGAAVTVAAVAWLGIGAFERADAITPAAQHFVTAPAGMDLSTLALSTPELQCGAPAPTPRLYDASFTLQESHIVIVVTARTTVADGADRAPAVIDMDGIRLDPGAAMYSVVYVGEHERTLALVTWSTIFVRDGVIVGVAPGPDPRFEDFGPDRLVVMDPAELIPAANCRGAAPAQAPDADSVDYEVITVAHVMSSSVLAAYDAVEVKGYTLEFDPSDPRYAPDAISCSPVDGVLLVAACAGPDAGFTWDAASGSVTLAADDVDYTRYINALLISDPFTVTVSGSDTR